MNPILSIIVPHYNDARIKNLLESLHRQTFTNFEVIVVDDKSAPEYKPDAICEEYRNKGLNIHLIESETKIFSFPARYCGLQAAHGRYVAFWDSDDLVLGIDGLGSLIDKIVSEQVEIISFSVHFIDDDLHETGVCRYANPLSTVQVRGRNIFNLFLTHNLLHDTALWGKIYEASLLRKIMPLAEQAGIRRSAEDIFLSTLACFYAESYLGVKDAVYGFYRAPNKDFRLKRALNAPSALVSAYKLVETMENIMQAEKCNQVLKDQFRQAIHSLTNHMASNFYYLCQEQNITLLPDELFQQVTHVYEEPKIYAKALALALFGAMHKLSIPAQETLWAEKYNELKSKYNATLSARIKKFFELS